MKQSSLARRQQAQRAALRAEAVANAASVIHVALVDLLGTRPGESHREALDRAVDARIAAQRWYRRLWQAVRGAASRFPLDMAEPKGPRTRA